MDHWITRQLWQGLSGSGEGGKKVTVGIYREWWGDWRVVEAWMRWKKEELDLKDARWIKGNKRGRRGKNEVEKNMRKRKTNLSGCFQTLLSLLAPSFSTPSTSSNHYQPRVQWAFTVTHCLISKRPWISNSLLCLIKRRGEKHLLLCDFLSILSNSQSTISSSPYTAVFFRLGPHFPPLLFFLSHAVKTVQYT